MKKLIKRAAAAALSLALIGGVMPFEAGTFDLSKISLTAEAASKPYIYDGDTKTLYFVDDIDLYAAKGIDDVCNRSEVLHINFAITVFPQLGQRTSSSKLSAP